MLNRIFVSALALVAATPAFAAEPAAPAEKPKCECCAKKDEAKSCCDKKDKAAEGVSSSDHEGHSAH